MPSQNRSLAETVVIGILAPESVLSEVDKVIYVEFALTPERAIFRYSEVHI